LDDDNVLWQDTRLVVPNDVSLREALLTEARVASESTFSTGGRVLDSFRSSLSPETVQALICCQYQVRSVDVAVNLKENIDDLKKFEDEMGTTSNADNGEDE
nr:hypothetical protein [Tanacetum cinerariifolium]